jgi:hypothetical protein
MTDDTHKRIAMQHDDSQAGVVHALLHLAGVVEELVEAVKEQAPPVATVHDAVRRMPPVTGPEF